MKDPHMKGPEVAQPGFKKLKRSSAKKSERRSTRKSHKRGSRY